MGTMIHVYPSSTSTEIYIGRYCRLTRELADGFMFYYLPVAAIMASLQCLSSKKHPECECNSFPRR